jgi:hypothetical protein
MARATHGSMTIVRTSPNNRPNTTPIHLLAEPGRIPFASFIFKRLLSDY